MPKLILKLIYSFDKLIFKTRSTVPSSVIDFPDSNLSKNSLSPKFFLSFNIDSSKTLCSDFQNLQVPVQLFQPALLNAAYFPYYLILFLHLA